MKTVIVWHLNYDIAIARGLASETEHIQPYVGAMFGEADQIKKLWDARCYEPVARVQVDDKMDQDEGLEMAYRYTNHIHEAWNDETKCPEFVKPLHNEKNRSSSIGDVFEIIGAEPTVTKFVSSFGFKPL